MNMNISYVSASSCALVIAIVVVIVLVVVVVIHLKNRQRTKRAAAAARLVTHHSSHTHSCISEWVQLKRRPKKLKRERTKNSARSRQQSLEGLT